MTTHEKIVQAYLTYIKEVENFESNGVKVSAVRARQALKDLSALTISRRREIQDHKKSI
jgi:hypothetical protein